MADQGVASFTTFAAVIFFARQLNPTQFGAVSIVLSVYSLTLGASRAVGTDSLLVRHSDSTRGVWAKSARPATATSALVGIVVGVLLGPGSRLLDPPLGPAILVLAIMIPALCTQDAWRFVFFSASRPQFAFANDCAWVLCFLAVAFGAWNYGLSTASMATAVWASGGVAACLLGFLQMRHLLGSPDVHPHPPSLTRQIADWLRSERQLIGRFLIEFVLITGTTQIVLIAVGIWHGLAASGSMRAAALLLGPATVLAQGLLSATVPEGARRASRPKDAARLVFGFAMMAGALVAVWSVAVCRMPTTLGDWLLSEQWAGAKQLVLPLGIAYAGLYTAMVMTAGLRSLMAVSESLRSISALAVLVIGSGVLAAHTGALAASVTMAVASWIGVVICALVLARASTRRQNSLTAL